MADGISISFRVQRVAGSCLETAFATADGALYAAVYRYERRGAEWWAVLHTVREIMPPDPHVGRIDESRRVPLPEETAADEAAHRRREWTALNG